MSLDRKLATIQEISKLEPHPNADKMEIASILGWKVCVKKGEFKPGDRCVYCEVDSVMPPKPEFEFLRPRNFRIKTVRLRGAISQGICFPLSVLGITETLEDIGFGRPKDLLTTICVIKPGTNVTELLGVKKYEVPLDPSSKAVGPFPGYLHRTDQTRIQVVPTLFSRWLGQKFEISEKLDGCSMTAFVYNGKFGVCGRNLELADGGNPYWTAARKYDLEAKLRSTGKNIALQGEVLNTGNWYWPKETEFRAYDLFFIDEDRYQDREALRDYLKILDIPCVPKIGEYEFTTTSSVEELVQMATRRSSIQTEKWLEGLVFSPMKEATDVELGRLSFKVINPEYDLQS